jgi:hypothetical protein
MVSRTKGTFLSMVEIDIRFISNRVNDKGKEVRKIWKQYPKQENGFIAQFTT